MRKKKEKKKFFETKYLLFGLLIIFIIFLIFLLVKNIFISQNDGFKIKSHVGDVKESVKKNDTNEPTYLQSRNRLTDLEN